MPISESMAVRTTLANSTTAVATLASTLVFGACSALFSASGAEQDDASPGANDATVSDATPLFDASPAEVDARANAAICVNGSCSVSVRLSDGDQDVSQVIGGPLVADAIELGIGDVDGDDTANELVGLRFQNLDIPMGADITDARIQFTAAETTTANDIVILSFEDSSLAPAFPDGDLEKRLEMSISGVNATWSLQSPGGDWVDGQSGLPQRTPIFFGAMQHLVDRTDWVRTDNAIVVLIRGMLGARVVKAYESGVMNSATIFVQYDEP